jgi:hypothetical protein
MKNSEKYAELIAHALSKVPTRTLCDTFCYSPAEGCYSCMIFKPDEKSCRKSEKEWFVWLTQDEQEEKIMAKFTVEITESKVIKTFDFMGKKFVNTWVPCSYGSKCLEKALEYQVQEAFPNIDEEALEQVEQLDIDDDETQDAITELSDYEEDNHE